MNILCDTDYLISRFAQEESTHTQAMLMSKLFFGQSIYYLDLVHFESATVLSRKYGSSHAKSFLRGLAHSDFIRIGCLEYEDLIWSEFDSQTKKGISFVDCANLVMARKIRAKIASFDRFYPENIVLKI